MHGQKNIKLDDKGNSISVNEHSSILECGTSCLGKWSTEFLKVVLNRAFF